MKKKPKIFLACDTSNIRFVRKIINSKKTNDLEILLKFGLEFFYSKNGRKFISKLKNEKIFLDLKFNDIPNTCLSAMNSLKDLRNISYITAHINGGYEMLKAVKKYSKKINKNVKVLGVSILTSLSKKSLKQIGHTKSIPSLIKKQAQLAKSAGLDGIVCSGHEIKYVQNICKNMEIVVPGIRLKGDKSSDQKRVMTPKDAFKQGANAIVIGRSLTRGQIKNNIQKLIKSL